MPTSASICEVARGARRKPAIHAALCVRDIHTGVQKVLGEQVSASSVKDYLHKDRRRKSPLFEYCGKSGYRLMR